MLLAVLKTVAWETYYRLRGQVKASVIRWAKDQDPPKTRRHLRVVP